MLINEHLIKDEIALDFLLEVCTTFKQEKGLSSLVQTLKKGNIESRLMDFFPAKKQTEEYLKSVFVEKDLAEVVKLHKAQASQEAKRELTQVNICFFRYFFLLLLLSRQLNSIALRKDVLSWFTWKILLFSPKWSMNRCNRNSRTFCLHFSHLSMAINVNEVFTKLLNLNRNSLERHTFHRNWLMLFLCFLLLG